jgi:hypothetical protein
LKMTPDDEMSVEKCIGVDTLLNTALVLGAWWQMTLVSMLHPKL